MKKKRLKGEELARKIAHEEYGEVAPARITGDWLRHRIRADFSAPEGGFRYPTQEDFDALAERANAIHAAGGVGPIRCGTAAIIAAALNREEVL